MNQEPVVSANVEEYLEQIYRLSKEQDEVTTTDLARSLKVSPASVTGMVKRLSERVQLQERLEQARHDSPLRGPDAALVVSPVSADLYPCVEEAVSGAAVESCYATAQGKARHVGDASDIDHGAAMTPCAEEGAVKRRRERSTLATRCDIAAAKVAHHVDSRELRKQGAVVATRKDRKAKAAANPDKYIRRREPYVVVIAGKVVAECPTRKAAREARDKHLGIS